jgi:molybdopterin-biosynthesis enzyme MoeA-like protein
MFKEEPKFYAMIIGTEILNGRREDKHFEFLLYTLKKYGYRLSGSFVIEDEPNLIIRSIRFIASLQNSILFSFGGIGYTPDDYTRESVAVALRDGKLYTHKKALDTIIKVRGERAYPYAVRMAELPKDSKLIDNTVNQIPAFYLDDRYFFMPGFPQMSHPMVINILDMLLEDKSKNEHRYTLTALTREGSLIDIMEKLPRNIELSSLPKIYDDGFRVTISIASEKQELAKEAFDMFVEALNKKGIKYSIGED